MSENTQDNQENTRESLFLQAIQERMAQMVVEYESKIADLRVEFTYLTQERDQLQQALQSNNTPVEVENAVQAPASASE